MPCYAMPCHVIPCHDRSRCDTKCIGWARTVYDRIFGDIPAKSTVYTLRAYLAIPTNVAGRVKAGKLPGGNGS
jgi:hypothetical protein